MELTTSIPLLVVRQYWNRDYSQNPPLAARREFERVVVERLTLTDTQCVRVLIPADQLWVRSRGNYIYLRAQRGPKR